MISKKFLKSSFIYTVAGALPMASMVILLPFYLFYLPIEAYGAMAVYTTFSVLLQVLITYSFDTSLYIHFHEYKSDFGRLSVFVSSAFVFMAITGVIVSLLAVGTGTLLFDNLYAGKAISFYPYGLLSVVTAIFQAFFKVYSSLLQSREKPVLFFWSNLLSFSLIASLTVGGLILFPKTLVGPVGGRMLAAFVSGVWVLIKVFREFGFHFNFRLLRTSFGYNNSTFIYQLQQWLITYFDRLMMTLYLTLTAVGTYDFAFKCLLVIDFIMGGLYNSFYPKIIGIVMGQQKKETTLTINRYYNAYMGVMMLLVCLGILFYPLLFDSGLVPSKYSGYKDSLHYLPFIGLIYLAKGVRTYFALPYGALKYPKPLPFIYLVVSIVKIGLMLLFIKSYGTFAVIGAAVVSSIVEILLLRYAIRNKFIFHFNTFKLIIAPVFLGAVIVSMEILVDIQDHIRHSFYLIFCAVLLGWVYRNELKLIKPNNFFK